MQCIKSVSGLTAQIYYKDNFYKIMTISDHNIFLETEINYLIYGFGIKSMWNSNPRKPTIFLIFEDYFIDNQKLRKLKLEELNKKCIFVF